MHLDRDLGRPNENKSALKVQKMCVLYIDKRDFVWFFDFSNDIQQRCECKHLYEEKMQGQTKRSQCSESADKLLELNR